MPQLLGLIFDLDGTLVDSAADLRLALNSLLAAQGRRGLTLDEVKQMVGDGLQVLMQRAFAATGDSAPETAMAKLFGDFLDLYQRQKASPDMLYPLALETIRSYRARDVRIGLCTNKLAAATHRLLQDIGIEQLFDAIAGCDTFPVCKPHPGHVLGVARAMNVLPQACVMIGDGINDIRAAQGAGMASIAVAHGYSADMGALRADAEISGFAELPNALKQLGFDIPVT